MQEVEYIATFLNLQINNKLVLKDIFEIEKKTKFIEFMRKNINHTNLSYLSSLAKLAELKKMFMQEQNRNRVEAANTAASQLENKFELVKTALKNELHAGKRPQLENILVYGKPYFTAFEIKELKKISEDVGYLVRMSDAHMLNILLMQGYTHLIFDRPQVAQIANNPIKTA
jgi:hypothetical protein